MNKIIYFFTLLSLPIFSQNGEYTIVNLKMNDENPHFGLTLDRNGNVLFTSYVLTKSGRVKKNGIDPILTLYTGQIDPSGEIIDIEPLQIDDKVDIKHITSGAFSPDGKTLYLTTNYINRRNKPSGNYKETNFHIEAGEYQDGVGWTNFKVLPFCEPKYSYAHPNVSPDGKTLYFIANIRGGKNNTRGPSDVFRVSIKENGTFGEPKNLGSDVNSYSREMFPFMSKDNILYFSSNKPNGVGGFDIYQAKMNDDKSFEKTEILPKPINSTESDLSFVVDENGNGYLASKRTGGKGDDDVYYFTKN